jgi:hypothetical protein
MNCHSDPAVAGEESFPKNCHSDPAVAGEESLLTRCFSTFSMTRKIKIMNYNLNNTALQNIIVQRANNIFCLSALSIVKYKMAYRLFYINNCFNNNNNRPPPSGMACNLFYTTLPEFREGFFCTYCHSCACRNL